MTADAGNEPPLVGIPASKRALRSQGPKTMGKHLDAAMTVLTSGATTVTR